ncbi:MAG: hypothetical protein D6686_15200 [Alphaproteobacteria bacterium]|nr:MAG: hypothetical protein D6686_15200 [Alphaproteobacteria bacterium]
MRLRALVLDFFGQFSGRAFDFGPGGRDSDFHIIHGPNEAGKTTTMEAYLRLLYGFPRNEPYAFRHQRKNLKVSGVFELGGTTLALSRLPRNAPSLVDARGRPLPEQAIAAHLGGLSEQDYRALLCLDDNTIETGGEDIANARGDIGRLLFSAAAGIADLGAVLAELREQADTLYRRRASTTRMAELKRELGEIEARIRDADIPVTRWRSLKQTAAAAAAAEQAARAERDRIRRDLEQARALMRVLPWLAEHDRLAAEIAPHADCPERLDIDPEALVALETEEAQLAAQRESLRAERDEAEAELGAIALAPELVALGAELDDLDELRSRMKTAALDLPRRRRELAEAETAIRAIARELGMDAARAAQPPVPGMADLQRLETAQAALRDARNLAAAEAREHEELAQKHAATAEALDRLRAAESATLGIAEILRRFEADSLAPELARAEAALAAARGEAEQALAALAHGGTGFAALPPRPMDRDRAAALAARHAELMREREEAARDRARHLEDAAARAARLDQIARQDAPIPDAEARAAREARDALWRAHLARPDAASASAFEAAMRRTDAIADARLARAGDLAEIRRLELDRAEAEGRAAAAEARIAAIGAEIAAIEAEIEAAAAGSGLGGITPAGLVDWLDRHAAAEAASRRARQVEETHAPTLRRAAELTDRLAWLLDLEDPSFAAALAAARRRAEEERQSAARLDEAARRLADLARERDRRAERADQAARAAEAARRDWAALVAALFGDALDPDALFAGLPALRELREHDQSRQRIARQIDGMEADQESFMAQIEALARRHGVAAQAPLDTFAALRQRAEAARETAARAARLRQRIARLDERIRATEDRRAEIDRTFRLLAARFPGRHAPGSIAGLRALVSQAQEVIARRRRIAELARQITEELATPDIAAARALVAQLTAADLAARIGGLERDLERAEARLSEAAAELGGARRDLAAVTGSGDVAALVQRRDALLAEIEETALDFLELDLGLALAEEAIRRYRDTHRSAMMEATERAFRDLTSGAYAALRSEADGSREVLLAIDAQGAAKRVGDLSKGTRFQLYLALRAAAYEQMVGQGVCLPFFCDDVFETFDEDRTRAACRLMERIGRSGQAIYLTHHRHVVEIAREVCDAQPMVHQL